MLYLYKHLTVWTYNYAYCDSEMNTDTQLLDQLYINQVTIFFSSVCFLPALFLWIHIQNLLADSYVSSSVIVMIWILEMFFFLL